ncbi:MAG: glycerate kinase [Sedimentisphaerales bacterium]|nr:glycerate kinase [Sedimentisphaerales bacterium]
MKIVVAMDSFKGSLSAVEACSIVAAALRAVRPEAEVVLRPMADGGEGTAAALMAAAGGRWIPRTVTGPLPQMRIEAGFVWLPQTRTAVVEMATASGLQFLEPQQQNPLLTTTRGTGELVAGAVERGAERILLAVGGSATVDGGVGAATALGWQFLTKEGRDISLGGGELAKADKIVPPEAASQAEVEVLCDVDNPLCGPHGAAQVYGPQKGATPGMVETLEAGLSHLAKLVKEQLGRDVADLPGAGAAGGLAAGAVAFMNARLVSGIDTVMSHSGLREALARADWVITGEGCFDEQSLRGKVVSGVARIARETETKVAVLAGRVLLWPEQYRAAGIETALPCADEQMDTQQAIAQAAALLDKTARRFARAQSGD